MAQGLATSANAPKFKRYCCAVIPRCLPKARRMLVVVPKPQWCATVFSGWVPVSSNTRAASIRQRSTNWAGVICASRVNTRAKLRTLIAATLARRSTPKSGSTYCLFRPPTHRRYWALGIRQIDILGLTLMTLHRDDRRQGSAGKPSLHRRSNISSRIRRHRRSAGQSCWVGYRA